MAVENASGTATTTLAKKSRLEMNIRQLLNKCEMIAKQEPVEGNWRLKKYVEFLNQMITDLMRATESGDIQKVVMPIDSHLPPEDCSEYDLSQGLHALLSKPSKATLAEYIKRATFLKGLIQTATLHSPIERLEAVQQLSHGAATTCTDAGAQEIHQKTVAKYGVELRSELLGLDDSDESLRKRNIIKTPNFTSNTGGQEDIDSLLKYHQNMQEKVAENMVMLTKSLKEQSQIASTIIRNDTEALKKSSELTDRNLSSLKVESERLQEHSRSAWKCWLWIMLAVVMAIFINMVLFMKVMKKRKYDSY